MGRFERLPVFVDNEEIDSLLVEVLSSADVTEVGEVVDDISELILRKSEIYSDFSQMQYAQLERWLGGAWREDDADFLDLAAGLIVGGRLKGLLPRLRAAASSDRPEIRSLAEEALADWAARFPTESLVGGIRSANPSGDGDRQGGYLLRRRRRYVASLRSIALRWECDMLMNVVAGKATRGNQFPGVSPRPYRLTRSC